MSKTSIVATRVSPQAVVGIDADIGLATPHVERIAVVREAAATAATASNDIDAGAQANVNDGTAEFMPWIAIVPSLLSVLIACGMYAIVCAVIAHASA
jgi:hypothetical protein